MGAGRNRRGIIIIVVVVVVLCVAVAGVLYFLNIGPGSSAQAEPTATPRPSTTNVIIAAQDIPRGTRLTVGHVTTMPWPLMPEAPVPEGALIFGDTPDLPGLEQVEGRVARTDILAGQLVMEQMLTPDDQPTDLANVGPDAALLIPAGRVAIAFPINRFSGVAYAIGTGAHVDILMSFRFVDVDEDFQTLLPNNVGFTLFPSTVIPSGPLTVEGRQVEDGPVGTSLVVIPAELQQRPRQVTQMVIQDAIVLRVGEFPETGQAIQVTAVPDAAAPAADQPTPTPDPAAASGEATAVPAVATRPDIVTLIVSRQDALVLKYALEIGADIDLVLRSTQDDGEDFSTDSVTLQYLLDFYGVESPPRLPIAHDPRIDLLFWINGEYPLQFGLEPTVTAPPP